MTMDRPPPTTTEMLYEPKESWGHAAVGVDGNVFLWGGWKDGPISASVVEVFNFETGRWEQKKTTGTPPRGAEWGAYTTIGNKAYYFGGWDGSSHYNSLHSLDLSTMQWVTLQPRNPSQGPSRKRNCGMVAHGDNELVVYGGYTGDGSYVDELHVYNLREGTWSTPHVTGTPPPPCHSFSFTKYNDHHAVLFGGREEGRDGVSDVYILNMETRHWSKPDTHGQSRPVGREGHTACLIGGPLMGSQHPQLLVIGGEDQSGRVLEDAWVLDLKTRTWRKVDLPRGVGPRHSHTATVVSSGPRSVMVVEFGGQRGLFGDIVAATTIVQIVSESRPGDPPAWRVVEVVSTEDPKKWRKKVDQLQKLDEDDLYDILAEATDVTKWFDTGLALGLKYSTLEKIKIKNREDVDDCRRDMLVCWLRRMDRVINQTGLPSWRSLVRALSGAVAYYPEIAEEIARKHL